ncbi:7-carboxy-7-deazaguanine synthase QueE [Geothermobacter hydrogeniphilus]|nr:7-carboxy-7-deazaguanine synthase QueE [Geothermobacter hydrogeniphilus]
MPVPATASTELPLVECFSSLQGEGLHIGRRQVFLRLGGCNLNCGYCDTDFRICDTCRFETTPGSGRFKAVPNPVSVETLCALLDQWLALAPNLHHALSLTGGEPLLHADALNDWLPVLAERLPIHLETNGTLYQCLPALMPHLTFLSIDLKLEATTGSPTPWNEHRHFLQAARSRPAQVKIVVDTGQDEEELVQGATLVEELLPAAPLFLQPVTRDGGPDVSGEQLLAWQQLLSRHHPDTRVVPQIHPLLRID